MTGYLYFPSNLENIKDIEDYIIGCKTFLQ